MNGAKKRCKASTRDGAACQATALTGSEFCFFHNPATAEERRAAQSLGGSQNRMKTLAADAPDVKVEDCEGVVRLLSETINHVRKGNIDPRVANAIGYLASVLIRAAEQGETEKRLAALELMVRGRNHDSPQQLTEVCT